MQFFSLATILVSDFFVFVFKIIDRLAAYAYVRVHRFFNYLAT
jgi:hypothetical protein